MAPDIVHPTDPTELEALQRDGTSQAERDQAALNPDYVAVDERSLKDLLVFTSKYAKELRYFGVEDGSLKDLSDWSQFLSSDPAVDDLNEIIAFMEDPAQLPADRAERYSRPHFALFLTFLQLLRHAQNQLNTLTRRHLDFYYQQVLHLTKRLATPDRVNVLVNLAGDTPQYELKVGTLLNAGNDSLGQPLVYRTDDDIVVNQAQIERLSSVYLKNNITGFREAREDAVNLTADVLRKLITIALGDPNPGDGLPKYPKLSLVRPDLDKQYPLTSDPNGIVVDEKLLTDLGALVNFTLDTNPAHSGLAMSFDDLRRLIQFKRQRDEQDDQNWRDINAKLEAAGKKRDPAFKLDPTKVRDFNFNLQAVVGDKNTFQTMFDGIPLVTNVYDAYTHLDLVEVQKVILQRLWMDRPTFEAMMQIKMLTIDSQWGEINRILTAAGQKKGKTLTFSSPDDFVSNLNLAVGQVVKYPQKPEPIANINDYYAALRLVERFFFMSAENFAYLMSMVVPPSDATTSEQWEKIYSILADAYKEKVYEQRRQALNKLRIVGNTDTQIFADMTSLALGEQTSSKVDADKLDRLKNYLSNAADSAFLSAIYNQINAATKVADADWDKVIVILDRVERSRLPLSVPQKVEWQNLYATEDATALKVSVGIRGDQVQPHWKTFGQVDPSASQSSPPPPEFGWAVSSPILALSQGERVITLILVFDKKQFDSNLILSKFPPLEVNTDFITIPPDVGPFRFQVSTKKGWIQPDTVTLDAKAELYPLVVKGVSDTYPVLKFDLTFGEKIDPIEVLGIMDGQVDSKWPALRLMLRQQWKSYDAQSGGRYITEYQPFRNLELLAVKIQVGVSGLTPLQMQNDESNLNPSKPFEPFGSRPTVGSRFYLGDPELATKKLDSLSFNFEWMGITIDLGTYYANYPSKPTTSSFTTQISLIDNRKEITLNSKAQLFNQPVVIVTTADAVAALDRGTVSRNLRTKLLAVDPTLTDQTKLTVIAPGMGWQIDGMSESYRLAKVDNKTLSVQHVSGINDIVIDDMAGAINAGVSGYQYGWNIEPLLNDDLLKWNRYFSWELNSPDFQHSVYPSLAVSKAVALAGAIASNKTGTALDTSIYNVNPPYTPKIKRLTVDYVSSVEIQIANYDEGTQTDRIFYIQPFGYNEIFVETGVPLSFLPHYTAEGSLYIGIRNLQPPQDLSILFRMAEGSADPELMPETVRWSYMDDNRWIDIDDGNILRDDTRGLINSGIIEFSLVDVQPSTALPANLYWLRAEIGQNSNSVCDTVAIHTQAVTATFADQGNALDHLNKPLASESITKLLVSVPEVTGIRQPYTSFGGKIAEQDNTFYRHISERLRHKQRALTIWDYERLVLQRFPEIYKVKCLPADSDNPGTVKIIVIPDIKDNLPFNPFEPKAPADLIANIGTYLQQYVPAFASVQVKNASYVPVQVRFDVRFLPGHNEGFYKQLLNDELNRFLSPWAYVDSADIVIGGRIYANAIINFIEKRPYVDYVANIKLFTSEDGVSFQPTKREDEDAWVETKRPDSVLVAAPQHVIGLISDVGFKEMVFSGIGYMKIELDFIVAGDK